MPYWREDALCMHSDVWDCNLESPHRLMIWEYTVGRLHCWMSLDDFSCWCGRRVSVCAYVSVWECVCVCVCVCMCACVCLCACVRVRLSLWVGVGVYKCMAIGELQYNESTPNQCQYHPYGIIHVTHMNESWVLTNKIQVLEFVTWLIHMCDMTHPYVWRDSFVCVIWLIIISTNSAEYSMLFAESIMSYVALITGSRHTYKSVISHIWTSRVMSQI